VEADFGCVEDDILHDMERTDLLLNVWNDSTQGVLHLFWKGGDEHCWLLDSVV
jgi:hypothetical protein